MIRLILIVYHGAKGPCPSLLPVQTIKPPSHRAQRSLKSVSHLSVSNVQGEKSMYFVRFTKTALHLILSPGFLGSVTKTAKADGCPGKCIHALASLMCDSVLENIQCPATNMRCCVEKSSSKPKPPPRENKNPLDSLLELELPPRPEDKKEEGEENEEKPETTTEEVKERKKKKKRRKTTTTTTTTTEKTTTEKVRGLHCLN